MLTVSISVGNTLTVSYVVEVVSTVSLIMLAVSCVITQDLIDEPPDEKNHRRCTVLRKYAFHQFTQLKFQESLENYLKIKEGVLSGVKWCHIVLSGVKSLQIQRW